MTPILVINLARRPDRLSAMQRRLADEGLSLERIDAIDARVADPTQMAARFRRPGRFGPLSPAEQACALSHLRAYETLLANPAAPRAVILEDDAVLTTGAGRVLSALDALPASVALLKLERERSSVMLGRPRLLENAPGYSIARLHSEHSCCTGYVISRRAAAALLALRLIPQLPVDFLLFHPLISPMFGRLRPHQLTPAIVEQPVMSDRDSDIEHTRTALTAARTKPRGWAKIRREALRIAHQAGRLGAACFDGAAWTEITTAPPPSPAALAVEPRALTR